MKLFTHGKGVFYQALLRSVTKEEAEHFQLPRIGRWACLTNVYVHPFIRGKGHSRSVIAEACDYADSKCIHLMLEVRMYSAGKRLNEDQLEALYESFGFESIGNHMIRSASEYGN